MKIEITGRRLRTDDVVRIIALTLGLLFAMLLCSAANAQTCVTQSQVTLTGNLRGANGIPTSNAIINLTPSQSGFIAGCGVNLPVSTACATSTDGSVVQLPNPTQATINTTGGTGSLPAGTYYSVYEWYLATGQVTLPSPESVTILSSSGALVVNLPSSGLPAAAIGMKVFISTTSGAETFQGQTTGPTGYIQAAPLVSGAAPSTTNNTVCAVTANDSVWPTGTGYVVTMTDSNGNAIPGFPMQWQLLGAGTTINLSNGLPYYHGVVTYPVPILASPQNHGAQSITGNLNLSGYNLLDATRVGIGTSTPGWVLDVEGGVSNFQQGFIIFGTLTGGTPAPVCPASVDGIAIDVYVTCLTPSTQLYGTIINGSTASSAVTQRAYLAVGPGTGLLARDVIGVGSQVSRTVLDVDATIPQVATPTPGGSCTSNGYITANFTTPGGGSTVLHIATCD